MKFNLDYTEKIKEIIDNKKYYINTMGCAMNENDSNKYSAILEKSGYIKTDNISNADLVLFNTCSVRENAENTLYGRLGELKQYKNMIIIVVGCMSQQKHVQLKIAKSYKYVNIVMGTNCINKLSYNIYKTLTNKEKIYDDTLDVDIVENTPINYDKSPSVSIIYGCNNYCSYCIVPYVRGFERSRNFEDILNDINNIISKGYKEVTLLGQNVNAYKYNDINFPKLLQLIEKTNIQIIKFMSPHPAFFTDELIEVISKSNKIYKQIHLPLQSGNNNILKQMNRKYTKEEYLLLVDKIKNKCKDVSFSTDIIVGFPNETNEEFLDTLDVVKKVKFDQVFMYIYSKRVGTKAALIIDNIEEKEKVNRLETLKEISKQIISENNEKMLNNIYDVIVEGISKNNDEYYSGRTLTNKIVIFKGDIEDIGNVIKVKIISNNIWFLKGEKVF
ncbi:MAG: tRNA (N6-isopentenyl adenosine(37)-C2)-methylthiotransferase MiaB [Clostridia bacterium]